MDIKIKRKCEICHKTYEASSGTICSDECWEIWKANSEIWQEFIRQFPWVGK